MARKSSDRLRTLLKLAALREQQAARQLAASGERLQQAEQQSRQLTVYQQEYQNQYVSRGQQQLSGRDLLNYHGFFRQLEQAQVQQGRAIEQRDQEREGARQSWLATHAKRRLLTQIRERRLASEQQEAEKRLQRELDDRVQRGRSGGFGDGGERS
jgi:flagellar export protein FliJ